MATAYASPRSISSGSEIKLEYGVPQIFALRFVTGKNVEGRFGPRVLFTADDDRKLWLDAEDGSDLERGMRELGIQPGDLVKVTKIRHPRGGGHSIRVEHADLQDLPLETKLERSIEMQRARTGAFSQSERPAPASQPKEKTDERNPLPNASQQPNSNPVSARMSAAMFAAVDAILETQAYATSRGLGLTFSEESVRAIGLSIYIGQQREGGR